MGIISHTCPHCGTADATFAVLGAQLEPLKGKQDVVTYYTASVGAVCPRCHLPIAVTLRNLKKEHHVNLVQKLNKFIREPHGPEITEFEVAEVWPKPPEPSIPAHIPASIEKAILQAERNYPIEGNEEASALMYRRSLELTLKDLFPDLKGTLAARIKQLVADKTLPAAMGDWADEIRDLGNDAAHEPTEVDRDQLTMIRGFTDATLRYLYTLPAEIEARRKLPDSAEPGGE